MALQSHSDADIARMFYAIYHYISNSDLYVCHDINLHFNITC